MPINPLPEVPRRYMSPEEFQEKADAFLGALPDFASEANDTILNGVAVTTAAEVVCTEARTTAVNSADSAAASANYKGSWSSLSGALSVPASVLHDDNVWMLTSNVANVASHTPGVSSVWVNLTGAAEPLYYYQAGVI